MCNSCDLTFRKFLAILLTLSDLFHLSTPSFEKIAHRTQERGSRRIEGYRQSQRGQALPSSLLIRWEMLALRHDRSICRCREDIGEEGKHGGSLKWGNEKGKWFTIQTFEREGKVL